MPEYLTSYDYGAGAIWLYLEAASADEINTAYPALTVFEKPPTFWTPEMESQTRKADFRTAFWQDWLANLGKRL